MNKNKIDELFQNLNGSFNINETPTGHQKRFLERLNEVETQSVKKLDWWKPLSIAASIAVIIAVGSIFLNSDPIVTDLASVSPEMKQTQTFFTQTINQELQTLQSFNNPQAKELVDDALVQIEILENEYNRMINDLAESSNDKRVIYAMISNFQNRIDLLEQVIEKIEEIKTLKDYRNETTI